MPGFTFVVGWLLQQQAESENRLMIVAKIAGNSRFLFIT